MGHLQVLEGTGHEIGKALQAGPFAGLRLRVTIDEDQEDLAAGIPPPPFAVRDEAHLDELLAAGLRSPGRKASERSLEQRIRDAEERAAGRNPR
jgi:hypothetical protein